MNNFVKRIEAETLVDVLATSVASFRERQAYSSPGFSLSYRAVDIYSSRFAAFLLGDLGMKKGERVAIQLPNLVHYPIAVFGALKAGMIVVNTNPLYTAPEVIHQFNDAGVTTLVVLDQLLPLHEKISDYVTIRNTIVVSPSVLDSVIEPSEGCIGFSNILIGDQTLAVLDSVSVQPDNVAFLQYTGGTTGLSKGAVLTHRNVAENAKQTLNSFSPILNDNGETIIVPLPLYHIYACAMAAMIMPLIGAHSVLISNPRDLDAFVDQIRNVKITCFAGINTLFVGLCQHEGFKKLDFSSLKLTLSGGTALTSNAEEQWFAVTGSRICEAYGMTEASPVISCNDVLDPRSGYIGKPVIDTEIKVVDENENEVELGKPGELWIRGPQVMKGYWNRPEATAEAIAQDGWLKTGDVVVETEDGFLKVVDRIKDMIIVSGFNVYPTEIEDVITSSDLVIECGVAGTEDDKTGEAVNAFVVPRDGAVTEEEIRQHCVERLTGYKVPKKIVFIAELPKSNVGKILRRELC